MGHLIDYMGPQTMNNDTSNEQLTYSIPHAAKVTDTSRSTIYRAIQEGDLDSVKVGGRRLIPKEALTRWACGEAAYPTRTSNTGSAI